MSNWQNFEWGQLLVSDTIVRGSAGACIADTNSVGNAALINVLSEGNAYGIAAGSGDKVTIERTGSLPAAPAGRGRRGLLSVADAGLKGRLGGSFMPPGTIGAR
jgi:hypothetical protein